MERIRRRVEDLDCLTATRRALDADRRRLVERDRDAVVVGERRLDHLPLNLAVQRDGDLRPFFRFGAGKAGTSAPCRLRRAYAGVVLADVDQRVLLRQLPERDAQPLRLGRIDRLHHRLERRRREVVLGAAVRFAEPVPDLDLPEAPELRDLARVNCVPLHCVSVGKDAERRHPAGVEAVADSKSPGEEPRVGDPIPVRTALDLEDARRERCAAVTRVRREQLGDSPHQVLGAGAGERRAEEDGIELARPRALYEIAVGRSERGERRGSRSEPVGRAHRDHGGRQALLDLVEHALGIRPGTVDLVHEEQRRDVEPLQRAHQDSRLRLHSFHRREHEHTAVEHAEHSLHLGDEVRMAGRVDQVDRDVVDRKRDDG